MKILGFDPGTARLGFGLIEYADNESTSLSFGIIETAPTLSKPERLLQIQNDLKEILEEFKPDIVGVEEIFFSKNVKTAISVAEARGIILALAAERHLKIIEIKPVEVKQAVCGNGQADKCQVQEMVKTLLNLDSIPKPDDAADALAIAIACSQINNFL